MVPPPGASSIPAVRNCKTPPLDHPPDPPPQKKTPHTLKLGHGKGGSCLFEGLEWGISRGAVIIGEVVVHQRGASGWVGGDGGQ